MKTFILYLMTALYKGRNMSHFMIKQFITHMAVTDFPPLRPYA